MGEDAGAAMGMGMRLSVSIDNADLDTVSSAGSRKEPGGSNRRRLRQQLVHRLHSLQTQQKMQQQQQELVALREEQQRLLTLQQRQEREQQLQLEFEGLCILRLGIPNIILELYFARSTDLFEEPREGPVQVRKVWTIANGGVD